MKKNPTEGQAIRCLISAGFTTLFGGLWNERNWLVWSIYRNLLRFELGNHSITFEFLMLLQGWFFPYSVFFLLIRSFHLLPVLVYQKGINGKQFKNMSVCIDVTSVMDPDPHGSTLILCGLFFVDRCSRLRVGGCLVVLHTGLGINMVHFLLKIFKVGHKIPRSGSALKPVRIRNTGCYAWWCQNSRIRGTGILVIERQWKNIKKSIPVPYVARDVWIVVGILGAVSRWDSDHYLNSMYSWVTSYPTTAIVFLGESSKMFSRMMSLIQYLF